MRALLGEQLERSPVPSIPITEAIMLNPLPAPLVLTLILQRKIKIKGFSEPLQNLYEI